MIGAFYDGVYLLGMVLNETLTEGGDIRDGLYLTRKMWNRDFHGKSAKSWKIFCVNKLAESALTLHCFICQAKTLC